MIISQVDFFLTYRSYTGSTMTGNYASWTDWFNAQDSTDAINGTNKAFFFKAFYTDCNAGACKDSV